MGFQFQIQWFLVNFPEIPFPSETQNYIKKEWKSKGGHLLRISVKLKTRKKQMENESMKIDIGT